MEWNYKQAGPGLGWVIEGPEKSLRKPFLQSDCLAPPS